MATSCVTCIPIDGVTIDGVTIDGSYVHNNGALMSKPNAKTEAILNVSIRTIDGVGVRNDPYARYADDEFVFIRDPNIVAGQQYFMPKDIKFTFPLTF